MLDNLEQTETLSTTKRALLALKQMKSKLEALERAKNEPVAIVGMGCRLPGNVQNPEDFWQLLENGVDAIGEVPQDRWDINAYYEANLNTPGKIYTRYGGFVPNLYDFDAQFFRLSPREAISLDPQQRLLLEVSWEALENGAIAPDRLLDSSTGVFIGICGNDYWHHLLSRDVKQIDAYTATGNCHSMAAGRLSYILGLTGPSLAVNTACSSSLVAVHLAINSLRNQECDLAIAAGVNRILLPEVSINFCQAQMLSPEGRCHTFDAAANGFVRAEGCGVIVLKRLQDAIAARDNILAVIRGSAVNHDGRASGLTVPNGVSQQAVIRKALQNAHLEPNQVDYIETHGTGTSLGDPIEVGALDAIFTQGRSFARPLIISSVKTNIGHTEATAGIVSLIKVVLALQHEQIPPHLHFHQPNPHINWKQLPFVVPTKTMAWTSGEKPRVAGVSSFGFSGTNAHVILEEFGLQESGVGSQDKSPVNLLTLSAKTATALKQLTASYQDYLVSNPHLNLGDICFTANSGRSHFNHRLSIVATSISELQAKLASFLADSSTRSVWQGRVQEGKPVKIVFLFSQPASEYIEIGKQLYQTQPTFRASIEDCAALINPYFDRDILDIFSPKKKANLERKKNKENTVYDQLTIFACQYALFQLWNSWGIMPTEAIGEGVGEYVMASVAGVFSLEDAIRLIVVRWKLLKEDWQSVVSKIHFSEPQFPLISSLSNHKAEITTPDYWYRHWQQNSPLTERLNLLPQLNDRLFLDLGIYNPSFLTKDNLYLFSLSREQEDWRQLLTSLAQLYVRGVAIDWLGFAGNYEYRKLVLPNYPFQRQSYKA